MTWLLAGLLIGVIAAGLYGFERQRQVYEQLVKTLEADRDGVIKEMRVYRNLLFPVLARADNPVAVADLPNTTAPKAANAVVVNRAGVVPHTGRPVQRLSFRQRFNKARKTTNTPQIKTDVLADAIRFMNQTQKVSELSKPEEKNHVN